jgi:hypothetical protein
VRPIVGKSQFEHAEQNPAMYRFQPISNIGKGPRHDDRHRVVDIGRFHFFLNAERGDALTQSNWLFSGSTSQVLPNEFRHAKLRKNGGKCVLLPTADGGLSVCVRAKATPAAIPSIQLTIKYLFLTEPLALMH